jgi:hypothetical protein
MLYSLECHETFVTLDFLAAVTKTLGLSTGILIAPQSQTRVSPHNFSSEFSNFRSCNRPQPRDSFVLD